MYFLNQKETSGLSKGGSIDFTAIKKKSRRKQLAAFKVPYSEMDKLTYKELVRLLAIHRYHNKTEKGVQDREKMSSV